MNYFISRGGQQYGPYTAAALQSYLAQGSIQYSDLARTETASEWLPLSQLLQAGQPFPLSSPAPPMQPSMPVPHGAGPVPPSLHWALVLVIGMLTGIFHYIWMLIQAVFIKKIDPRSNATLLYVFGFLAMVGGVIVALGLSVALQSRSVGQDPSAMTAIIGLMMAVAVGGGWALIIAGAFSIRSSMVRYYNSVEPINLRLSGAMTFFFNTLYFQYHFTRIAKWKETGILYPQ